MKNTLLGCFVYLGQTDKILEFRRWFIGHQPWKGYSASKLRISKLIKEYLEKITSALGRKPQMYLKLMWSNRWSLYRQREQRSFWCNATAWTLVCNFKCYTLLNEYNWMQGLAEECLSVWWGLLSPMNVDFLYFNKRSHTMI